LNLQLIPLPPCKFATSLENPNAPKGASDYEVLLYCHCWQFCLRCGSYGGEKLNSAHSVLGEWEL